MAELATAQFTVAASPVVIAAANPNRTLLNVTNLTTVTIFVGGAAVSTATGHAIPTLQQWSTTATTALSAIGSTSGTVTTAEVE
jgi:hypothetical protein